MYVFVFDDESKKGCAVISAQLALLLLFFAAHVQRVLFHVLRVARRVAKRQLAPSDFLAGRKKDRCPELLQVKDIKFGTNLFQSTSN